MGQSVLYPLKNCKSLPAALASEATSSLISFSQMITDNLGEDVGAVEALLAHHNELKESVDIERGEVDKFTAQGRALIESENCDKDEVNTM